MRTLDKEVTRHFYKNENGYEELTKRWSELCNNSETRDKLKVEHYVFYAILRGKDWTKAVPFVTNSAKVENGAWGESGVYKALTKIRGTFEFWPFDGIISDNALAKVRELLPKNGMYYHVNIERIIADPYPGIVEVVNV